MPTRNELSYNSVSRRSENGGRWKGGGNSETTYGDRPGSVVTNASIMVADLVDTKGVLVDGTATRVDNVLLVGNEIILRAKAPGTGGDVDNGLWRVPADPTQAWSRHREELHIDGLPVFVRGGEARARGTTGAFVDFGGMRDTLWKLITATFTLGTDAIEFRQQPAHDGLTLTHSGGLQVIPGAGTLQLGFDGVGTRGQDSRDIYMTYALGGAALVQVEYSALYNVGVSVFGSRVSGAGPLAVDLYVGPSSGAATLYQNVIYHQMTTLDERYYGATIVRLAGDQLEKLEVHLRDPAGVGFSYTLNDAYLNISTAARR